MPKICSVLKKKIVFFTLDNGLDTHPSWNSALVPVGTKKKIKEYLEEQIQCGEVKVHAVIDWHKYTEEDPDFIYEADVRAQKMFEGMMLFSERLEVDDWSYFDDRPPVINPILETLLTAFLAGKDL